MQKVKQNFHTAVCNYNHDMINTATENKNGFRGTGSGPDQWAATEWDKKDNETMKKNKEKEAVGRQWRCKAGCSHGTASSVVPWLQSAEYNVQQARGAPCQILLQRACRCFVVGAQSSARLTIHCPTHSHPVWTVTLFHINIPSVLSCLPMH